MCYTKTTLLIKERKFLSINDLAKCVLPSLGSLLNLMKETNGLVLGLVGWFVCLSYRVVIKEGHDQVSTNFHSCRLFTHRIFSNRLGKYITFQYVWYDFSFVKQHHCTPPSPTPFGDGPTPVVRVRT